MIRKIILYVLYFALVIFMAVVIVRNLNDTTSDTTPKTQSSQKAANGTEGTPKKQSSSTPKSESNSTKKTAVPTNAGSTAANNLTNSGPGSVIGLFLVATVAGAVGFSWYQRRRIVDTP